MKKLLFNTGWALAAIVHTIHGLFQTVLSENVAYTRSKNRA